MNSRLILNSSARPLNRIYNWRVRGRYSPLILAPVYTCAHTHSRVRARARIHAYARALHDPRDSGRINNIFLFRARQNDVGENGAKINRSPPNATSCHAQHEETLIELPAIRQLVDNNRVAQDATSRARSKSRQDCLINYQLARDAHVLRVHAPLQFQNDEVDNVGLTLILRDRLKNYKWYTV